MSKCVWAVFVFHRMEGTVCGSLVSLAGLFCLRPSHSLLFSVSQSFLAIATWFGALFILSYLSQ